MAFLGKVHHVHPLGRGSDAASTGFASICCPQTSQTAHSVGKRYCTVSLWHCAAFVHASAIDDASMWPTACFTAWSFGSSLVSQESRRMSHDTPMNPIGVSQAQSLSPRTNLATALPPSEPVTGKESSHSRQGLCVGVQSLCIGSGICSSAECSVACCVTVSAHCTEVPIPEVCAQARLAAQHVRLELGRLANKLDKARRRCPKIIARFKMLLICLSSHRLKRFEKSD